jgi:hypothetical protein
MSWTQRFIWAFWIFVIIMLVWQFYDYNKKISTPDPNHPAQDHYFFYMPKAGSGGAAAAAAEHDGPYVEQTDFRVEDGVPTSVSFTCHVTLKNIGKAKATGVEVCVRPFRGTQVYDDTSARNDNKVLPDDSPLAQISQWVTFPDLAPGESSTQSAVFMRANTSDYGENPKPEIIYEPEKK